MKFLVTGGAGFIGSSVIGVLGLGYIGLPLMLKYSELGFKRNRLMNWFVHKIN